MKTYIIRRTGRLEREEIERFQRVIDSYLEDRQRHEKNNNESAVRMCDNKIKIYEDMKAGFLTAYADICKPLDAILAEAQKGARTRKINAQDVLKALCHIEDTLSIHKTDMDGIKVHVDLCSQSFANAYKGIPQSTHFEAEFHNYMWRTTDIRRDICGRNGEPYTIKHTAESAAAIVERYTHF